MEEGKARPSDGVLAHLELLEARAHEAAVKEEEEEEREEKLARLKARVQELRLQRDELRAKLELQQKGQLGEGGAVSDGAQPSARAVLEWKIRSLQAMLGVFYLTGLSGKLTERGVCFCISTAYGGTYLDSYHLDLLLHLDVQIGRHSVPACIPLQQLAQKYLQTDVRRFLAVLAAHLNAYAGRRYQADQLQERFSDQLAGSLQRNSLCNLLVFHYHVARESKTFPLRARLLYGDLCCSLPTEVSVSCPPDAPASLAAAAAAHSELFRRVGLPEAFLSLRHAEASVVGAP